MATELERLARLETEVKRLRLDFEAFQAAVAKAATNNRDWVWFLVAQAVQTGILYAALRH